MTPFDPSVDFLVVKWSAGAAVREALGRPTMSVRDLTGYLIPLLAGARPFKTKTEPRGVYSGVYFHDAAGGLGGVIGLVYATTVRGGPFKRSPDGRGRVVFLQDFAVTRRDRAEAA